MATIPLNLLFCLLLGLCLAACARTQFHSGALPWRGDLFAPVLTFSLLSVAPAAIYLYLAYPEWSWMYLVDPPRLPRGTGLAAIVLTVLLAPIGYLLGWLGLRLFGPRGLYAQLGVVGAGLLAVLALGHRRLFYLARYEDFQPVPAALVHAPAHELMRPITQGKLFFALLCILPLVAISLVAAARLLWIQGRWLRQQAAASSRSGEHLSRPEGHPTLPARSTQPDPEAA